MDKVILFENDNGLVSMANGETTLPEGVLGFTVIDQTKKDDSGISSKEEYTIGKPVKSHDLELFSETLSLPTLNSENVYTLDLLQLVDSDAEWHCVVALPSKAKDFENWKYEGSYITPMKEVALLSKPITSNMTVCSTKNVLSSTYEEIVTKDNKITR